MHCEIRPTPHFLKEMKRLSKRYRSLKNDVDALVASLHVNPFQGVDLGKGVRKIRMSVASKGKGKRGGMRVITLNILIDKENADVLLLSIYDKSEHDSISDREISEIIACSLKG